MSGTSATERRLDVAASVAILVTCLIASTLLLHKLDVLPSRGAAGVLNAGDRLPPAWHAESGDVVAVVRSTCGYCTESMPFYREVARTRRLIVVTDEPAAMTGAWLGRYGVTAAQIVSVPGSTQVVPGTPTLFVVDERGRIVLREVGRLPEAKARQLLRRIRA